MERRSLLEEDTRDVFGDEYETEEFDGVVDGHRPSDHDREGGEQDHDAMAEQPIRTVSAQYADTTNTPMVFAQPSRNSTRKSRDAGGADNPFASPDDGDETTPSLTFEPESAGHRRSISLASSHNFARTGSTRFASGPSHPYGMYPQGTVPRSPSIATQSTIRPPHRQSSSLQQNGPQHPYTHYPQGVTEDIDDDDDDLIAQQPVPVGFLGLGQSYQRRLGPDGEEQDIIGADGHTEQLPPYSRYPEDGPEKVPLLVPEAPRALHSRAPVAGTDPTMALMHTPLMPQVSPQPQSMTDASSLRPGRPQSMANVELLNSREDSIASQKSWKEKNWSEKRETRFCGIPFWCILLTLGVLVFIAAVLGGVIGGFMEGAEQHHKTPFNAAKSSYYDASVIATPTNSPATGTFQLALSTPQETSAGCLTVSDQAAAWSCDLAGPRDAAISVGTPQGSNELGAFIFYGSNDGSIAYGAQTSFMETSFAPFAAVTDNDDPESGPAYYFSQFYDKLVVVPQSALTATSNNKRQIQLDESWFQQKQIAKSGDKPWFCVWNNTFMEGFIYVEQTILQSYAATTATTAGASVAPSPIPAMATTPSPPPTLLITTTVTEATTTVTYAGEESMWPNWASANLQDFQPNQSGGPATHYNNGDDNDDNDDGNDANHKRNQKRARNPPYDSLSLYPYIVKIEERRLPGNTVPPYCQQYQILADGGYNWVPDSNGNPITVQLEEMDPSYSAYESAGIAGASKQKRDGSGNVGGCHCQWMSGQGGYGNILGSIG